LFQDSDHGSKPIDINDLAMETLQILRGHLNDHGIKTDIELTAELPPVMGERVQLQEVIFNLINNAIDAMASVDVGHRVLRMRTKPEDKIIVVEIEDSGGGIERGSLDKIFEPFVTTKPNGTGLGLAICNTIIERHGGRLAASSEGKNRGALFQISLPAAGRVA
jgi:C4-dicarboxylate-specific signal transduction histidine kinase